MNYYAARQVNPQAERPDAGKWRWTRLNDDLVYVSGACADECPGHETAEEACQHYVEGELANVRLDVEYSDWCGCDAEDEEGVRCDRPTKRGASFGPGAGPALCDEHCNADAAEKWFRDRHQGSFVITSSW